PYCGGHREAMVRVDHQADIIADCLAYRLYPCNVQLGRAQSYLHLDCGEAFFNVTLRLVDGFFDQPIHIDEVQAGRVGLHLVPECAAYQLVHGLTARLADDVPQGDVDAADGRDGHPAGTVILDPVVQVFPDHFDVEGIPADDARSELRINESARYVRWTVAFTPSHHAVLRLDLDDAGPTGLVEPAP